MAGKAVSALKDLQKEKADMARHTDVYPAFDELTLLALERRHLEIPAFTDVIVEKAGEAAAGSLKDHLSNNVRLMRITEVAFDTDEPIHLPGVESAITAMRGRGFPSLKREEQDRVFVQGLERMIRAMRGKTYTWLTVADPMPQESVRFALDQCRSLQSDIHQLV